MALLDGITMLKNIITETSVFGITWIIPLVILFICILLVARTSSGIKVVGLPISIILHLMGIRQSFLVYMVLAIVFVMELLSMESLDDALGVLKNKGQEFYKTTDSYKRKVIRDDIKKTRAKSFKIGPLKPTEKSIDELTKLFGK